MLFTICQTVHYKYLTSCHWHFGSILFVSTYYIKRITRCNMIYWCIKICFFNLCMFNNWEKKTYRISKLIFLPIHKISVDKYNILYKSAPAYNVNTSSMYKWVLTERQYFLAISYTKRNICFFFMTIRKDTHDCVLEMSFTARVLVLEYLPSLQCYDGVFSITGRFVGYFSKLFVRQLSA